jgi:hypothetical protein
MVLLHPTVLIFIGVIFNAGTFRYMHTTLD